MGDAELTAAEITAWFEARGAQVPARRRHADRRPRQTLHGRGQGRARPPGARLRPVDHRNRLVRQRPRQQLRRHRRLRQLHRARPAFPTPRDGVRGQIQLLRNYADPASRAANLANPPSPPIYGSDPVRAAQCYDTFFAKGRTPTWNVMGNGNWATDPGYAPKVLTLYFQMVSFATRDSACRHLAARRSVQKSWVKQRSSIVPSTRSR